MRAGRQPGSHVTFTAPLTTPGARQGEGCLLFLFFLFFFNLRSLTAVTFNGPSRRIYHDKIKVTKEQTLLLPNAINTELYKL